MSDPTTTENKDKELPISLTEKPKKRIGIAKGKSTIPDNFDEKDKEIEEMFEEHLQ